MYGDKNDDAQPAAPAEPQTVTPVQPTSNPEPRQQDTPAQPTEVGENDHEYHEVAEGVEARSMTEEERAQREQAADDETGNDSSNS